MSEQTSLNFMQQTFWRCMHHPIATQNFFEGRTSCGWKCHEQPLLWHHNGVHPMPENWSGDLFERR
jgi:hypothetical protein